MPRQWPEAPARTEQVDGLEDRRLGKDLGRHRAIQCDRNPLETLASSRGHLSRLSRECRALIGSPETGAQGRQQQPVHREERERQEIARRGQLAHARRADVEGEARERRRDGCRRAGGEAPVPGGQGDRGLQQDEDISTLENRLERYPDGNGSHDRGDPERDPGSHQGSARRAFCNCRRCRHERPQTTEVGSYGTVPAYRKVQRGCAFAAGDCKGLAPVPSQCLRRSGPADTASRRGSSRQPGVECGCNDRTT